MKRGMKKRNVLKDREGEEPYGGRREVGYVDAST